MSEIMVWLWPTVSLEFQMNERKKAFFYVDNKKETKIIVEKVIELVVFENLDSRIFIYSW